MPNGLQLQEVGDFTTKLHTKHTLQTYEKLSYEALNRQFFVGAVTSWRSVSQVTVVFVCSGFLCFLCRLCGRDFKNFRREGNFKK